MKFCLIYNQISLSLHYQDFMFLRAKNVEKSVIFLLWGIAELKISRTFALPFEKRVTRKSGNDKFIEKTDLLYKKQVPRNTIYREALISL